MDRRQRKGLEELGESHILFDVPMAEYTSFKAGGKVEALYQAHDADELQSVVHFLRRESIPWLILGRGSNLLVRDGGLAGVAIRLCGSLEEIVPQATDPPSVLCGAGAPLSRLVAFCGVEGMGGMEFLAGIPGTVGGAIAMNAGSNGREMADVTLQILLMGPGGEVSEVERFDLDFSYRSLKVEAGSVIMGGRFRLERSDRGSVSARISAHLKRRKDSQPLEFPSAGSVFKNPPGDHAGRLIEKAGLKGVRRGGAMISPKHANYIVNLGGATAGDILSLAEIARERVREETGHELELELRVVGR